MQRVVVDGTNTPLFAVEVEGPESPFRGGATDIVNKAAAGIADVGEVIAKSCNDIMGSLKSGLSGALPDEVELSFGVTLGGEAAIPLITKASGESTFTVRVCWKPESGN